MDIDRDEVEISRKRWRVPDIEWEIYISKEMDITFLC